MTISIDQLATIIETRMPTTKTRPDQIANQITVYFQNRPDIEVSLLTPWYQSISCKGGLTTDHVTELVNELQRIGDDEYGR